ncbi:TatD family hydrolase [Dehalobacterium formicoaceticum]|uniref:TatD family hydrolase n=1 Tax=Dehalobacterium formicoaceticum TaxID=51515 RepID=A0ABT1Y314_9FIRM|nr:TatD family hydrolase [Dehalobacterium formicoaceticum]
MNTVVLFDTHAHLNDPAFAGDLEAVIERAGEAGVKRIATVGYDLPSSVQAIKLAKRFKGIYAVIGLHPHDATALDEDSLYQLEVYAREPEVVAIGEIGLDYYRDHSPRDVQQEAFRKQIRLAKKLGKPIVIHDREAHGDTMQIIKEEKGGINGGIFHCFSGSWEMARQCITLGFHISMAGPVTFKNANKLLEVAKMVPLDRLLVETDCPYLTPHPYRGKRNEPARVRLVAERIAELRGISLEKLAEATTKNAMEVYQIAPELSLCHD